MCSNVHADQESIAASDCGGYSTPTVGIDATGATHYYDSDHDRVLVTRDGDVTHVRPLRGRSLGEWAAFVEARRGWRVNYLDDGLAAVIRTAVEAANG